MQSFTDRKFVQLANKHLFDWDPDRQINLPQSQGRSFSPAEGAYAALVREWAVWNTMCTYHPFHTPVAAVSRSSPSYRQTGQLTVATSSSSSTSMALLLLCTCHEGEGRGESRRGRHCWVLGLSPCTRHLHVTPTTTQDAVQKHPHLPLVGTTFLEQQQPSPEPALP